MESANPLLAAAARTHRPRSHSNVSDLSMASSIQSIPTSPFSLRSWARDEILNVAQIFHPQADLSDEDLGDESSTLLIACALTLKALSTTKADVTTLETSLTSVHRNVDKVLKDVTSVSSRVNAVSNTIASNQSKPASFASVVMQDSPPGPASNRKPSGDLRQRKEKGSAPASKPSTIPKPAATPVPATPAAQNYSPAERRMYATLQSQAEIPDSRQKAMLIPQVIATVLRNHDLPFAPCKVTATINSNGTVSVTAPQGYCSSFYQEYYTEMSRAIQDFLQPQNNTYQAFRPAPSKSQVMVNRVPVFPLSPDPAVLRSDLASLILISTGIQVEDVRRLNPDSVKATTSLVITVAPSDVSALTKNGILLFNKVRTCELMWNASSATQCTLCWKFGHPSSGCKKNNEYPTCCRICGSPDHTAYHHPCPTNCPKTERKKGFCSHMVPLCLNCQGNHPANDPQCPARILAISSLKERNFIPPTPSV